MAKDILLDEDGDLLFKNGDLVIGNNLGQQQEDLLVSAPGTLKNSPTRGVGLFDFIDDEGNTVELQTVIQREFEADGLHINDMNVEDINNIQIDAE